MMVLLRFTERMTPQEIAEVTDTPVNTVKSYINRALISLRKTLDVVVGV
jgi:DNA-directed RNA polymerase specialized sigma24 family protein